MADSFDFGSAPGHLIRRAQQRAVAIFMAQTSGHDITPIQFAVLNALIDDPGEDQVTLANRVAFDAATSGSVIGRLEAKGWIRRESDPQDRRRKLLWVTPAGERVAQDLKQPVAAAQNEIMKPLNTAERAALLALLIKLVGDPTAVD